MRAKFLFELKALLTSLDDKNTVVQTEMNNIEQMDPHLSFGPALNESSFNQLAHYFLKQPSNEMRMEVLKKLFNTDYFKKSGYWHERYL